MTTPKTDIDALRDRVQRLGFFGLLASWNDIALAPWLPELVNLEERERKRRSLERRLRAARIGAFKSMADFDWAWPSRVDRDAVDDLLSLKFVDEGINAVLIGPNGVGKTMILRNVAHQASNHPVGGIWVWQGERRRLQLERSLECASKKVLAGAPLVVAPPRGGS